MTLAELLNHGRQIWGNRPLKLGQIIVRLGVTVGDLCRLERRAEKDVPVNPDDEIQKELGNIIFSTIRWCDDLGYDPDVCIKKAIEAQEKFARENKTH